MENDSEWLALSHFILFLSSFFTRELQVPTNWQIYYGMVVERICAVSWLNYMTLENDLFSTLVYTVGSTLRSLSTPLDKKWRHV